MVISLANRTFLSYASNHGCVIDHVAAPFLYQKTDRSLSSVRPSSAGGFFSLLSVHSEKANDALYGHDEGVND